MGPHIVDRCVNEHRALDDAGTVLCDLRKRREIGDPCTHHTIAAKKKQEVAQGARKGVDHHGAGGPPMGLHVRVKHRKTYFFDLFLYKIFATENRNGFPCGNDGRCPIRVVCESFLRAVFEEGDLSHHDDA